MSGQSQIPGLCEVCGKHGDRKRELTFIEHLLCARNLVDRFSRNSHNNQARWVLLTHDAGEGTEAWEG